MKLLVILMLSAALIGGLSVLFLQGSEEGEKTTIFEAEKSSSSTQLPSQDTQVRELEQSVPSTKAAVIPALAKKHMDALKNKKDHSLDNTKRTELEFLVDEKQIEIDGLIVSLNDNLQNENERHRIQAKLDSTIEQYNALLLPLALDKMSASVND
jgi:hypothetical protein